MISLRNIKEDAEYLEEIYPNVWLMDDHKWSYFVWENFKRSSGLIPSTLVHIDYHWDAINDFKDSEAISLIVNPSLSELKELIKEDKYIRKDSYIAPAIINKMISKIFVTIQHQNIFIMLKKVLDMVLSEIFQKQTVFRCGT